jgi:hypothetical protein
MVRVSTSNLRESFNQSRILLNICLCLLHSGLSLDLYNLNLIASVLSVTVIATTSGASSEYGYRYCNC